MLTGPTIWSYLSRINNLLHKSLHPCDGGRRDLFWSRNIDITSDAVLVYQCYICSLERFSTINRGVESRISVKDIVEVEACCNRVELTSAKEHAGVQNITFRADDSGDDLHEHDWGMALADDNTLKILHLYHPVNEEIAQLLVSLVGEMEKAILFHTGPPSHWQEDMASSRRLGVWKRCVEKNSL